MEYQLHVPKAISGDTIPLFKVAEAMARHAASGYGELPIHGPTLSQIRPRYITGLLADVNSGDLRVCDAHGFPLQAPCKFGENEITSLFVRHQHLTDWAKANGNVFIVHDILGEVFVTDSIDRETGKVIEAGYSRIMVDDCSPGFELIESDQPAPDTKPQAPPAKPLQRTAAQDIAILAAIRQAGHDPLMLPVNESGKPGVKAAIREALKGNKLFVGGTVFDKAWERLRNAGNLADKT